MRTTNASVQQTQPPPKAPPLQESNHTDSPVTGTQAIRTLAFLKIWQILGDPKANPPVEPLLPISRASFYAGIKAGIYPAPIKIFGGRASFWPSEQIYALLAAIRRGEVESLQVQGSGEIKKC